MLGRLNDRKSVIDAIINSMHAISPSLSSADLENEDTSASASRKINRKLLGRRFDSETGSSLGDISSTASNCSWGLVNPKDLDDGRFEEDVCSNSSLGCINRRTTILLRR